MAMAAAMTLTPKALDLPASRKASLRKHFAAFFERGRPKVIRDHVRFAEEAIRVDDTGIKGGGCFSCETQPFSRLVLQEFDNRYWTRHVGFGCVQSGKTLLYLVIPAGRHLFEIGDNFGVGVPQMEVAADKWRDEFFGTFNRSFPELMPTFGTGSRGGSRFEAVTFKNGRTLKFLSGQGKSEKRSGITLKAISVTEADKVDRPPINTTDPNPIGEIEGRLASFGDDGRFWGECTVTTPKGWVYREWKAGSQGQILKPCPHCRQFVVPGRKDLVGWENAPDEITARESAWWACPSCGEEITEDQRRAMCRQSVLVHRGQSVRLGDNGEVIIDGPLPRTRTCGIRWSAFDNMFWTTEFIAAKNWRAANPIDEQEEESTEKWVSQYMWAEPWEAEVFDLMPLTLEDLKGRVSKLGVAKVPPNAIALSCGMDCRQTQLHYVVRAWTSAEGVIESSAIDIGTMEVRTKELGIREALLEAMRQFRDGKIMPGYFDEQGQKFAVGWTLVDAGWQERVVWEFMLENAELGIPGFAPIFGRGQSQPPGAGSYRHPDDVKGNVLWIGENCHIRRSSKYEGLFAAAGATVEPMYVIGNSDEWKAFVRYGYMTPPGQNGALWTFNPVSAEEHRLLNEYRKQIRAETKERRVVPGRGVVEVFTNTSRKPNHLGDCDYYSAIAGHLCGVRIAIKRREFTQRPAAADASHFTMPDGRPFMTVTSPGSSL